MKRVNIHNAKTHLSSRLVPVGTRKRRLGLMKGKFKTPPNYDSPLPKDFLRAFEA